MLKNNGEKRQVLTTTKVETDIKDTPVSGRGLTKDFLTYYDEGNVLKGICCANMFLQPC